MVRTEFETIRQMVDMNLSVIRIKLDDLDAAWRMPIEEMLKEEGYTVVDKLENTYIFKREGK